MPESIKTINFEEALNQKIIKNLNCNYSSFLDENFYNHPYEPKVQILPSNLKDKIFHYTYSKYYAPKHSMEMTIQRMLQIKISYFQYCYDILEDQKSKDLLIELTVMRICGAHKIKLSIENSNYLEYHKEVSQIENKKQSIPTNFRNIFLTYFEFDNLKLFNTVMGVVTIFKQEQYANKLNNVYVEENDIVFDCGGCWGETALYFSEKTKNGKVFSFEFIESNIDIFKKNIILNDKKNIEIIPHPLWSEDNLEFYYFDNGPASQVSLEKTKELNQIVKSTTIDKIVSLNKLNKVDFIKMDIEGAELEALKGAVESLKKYKPKLAISLYHKNIDFYTIPHFINDLNLGYKFYLGHATPTQSETVLFAAI